MLVRKIEITVGAFMLLGVFALVILAFEVSGLTPSEESDEYIITANFENIGGLTVRGKVSIAGVVVGRVTNITLDKNRYEAVVEMAIKGQFNNIPTDSSATILTAGLLGEKYIGFSIGAEEEYLVQGDNVSDTQSAVILEELIGQFLVGNSSSSDE